MNRTLSFTAAALLFAGSANAASVITYYSFDSITGGTTIEDQVGSADITTVAGTLNGDSPLGDTLGSSFTPSGTSTVPSANAPTLGLGDFSITFWMNIVDDDNNPKGVLDMLAGITTGGLQLNFGTGANLDKLALGIGTAGGFQVALSDALAPGTHYDKWTHVALTVDRDGGASGVQFYVDGNSYGSASAAGFATTSLSPTQNLEVGAFNNSNPIDQIDDLAIFSGVLTAQEVSDLADGTASIPEPGSLALLGLGGLLVASRRRRG